MEIGASPSSFQCVNPAVGGVYSSIPHFPPFHLLRSYNYLMTPRTSTTDFLCKTQVLQSRTHADLLDVGEAPKMTPPPLVNYAHYNAVLTPERLGMDQNGPSPKILPKSTCGVVLSHTFRKQRGEKKPIPDEQKDEKYYERRRRNNQAAKKSRDARKQREDQIALRATLLEHENALLKAQLLTVREEASSLRQLLLEKKSTEFSLK